MKEHGRIIVFAMVLMFSGSLLAQDTTRNRNNNTNNQVEREVNREQNEVVDKEKRQKIINDAEETKNIVSQRLPESSNLFETSAGYAIFPNVGKGAYILGGAAGNGVVYEDGERVGFAELRQLDIGLQLGGQAYRQVIFFETREALNRFKEGNFEFGGNASAVILDEGRAESINFNDGVAVVTIPKAGAMLEISLAGQKFYYGAID